jgi:hypothetical protein
MSLSSRRPTQYLNINCSDCGVATVRFESFVGDGPVFQMVGTKLSEIMAFMSTAPDVVLCTACQEKRVSAETTRKQLQRERILQHMALPPPAQQDVEGPARYPLTMERRHPNPQAAQEEKATKSWLPRRTVSHRDKNAVPGSVIPSYDDLTFRVETSRTASLGGRVQSGFQL